MIAVLKGKESAQLHTERCCCMHTELGFPQGGPTLRKLESYPQVLDLCLGAYGESSEGVRSLMDKMVESRLRHLGLRRGSPESSKELGIVTGLLRR